LSLELLSWITFFSSKSLSISARSLDMVYMHVLCYGPTKSTVTTVSKSPFASLSPLTSVINTIIFAHALSSILGLSWTLGNSCERYFPFYCEVCQDEWLRKVLWWWPPHPRYFPSLCGWAFGYHICGDFLGGKLICKQSGSFGIFG
jgi:hypothetical protein